MKKLRFSQKCALFWVLGLLCLGGCDMYPFTTGVTFTVEKKNVETEEVEQTEDEENEDGKNGIESAEDGVTDSGNSEAVGEENSSQKTETESGDGDGENAGEGAEIEAGEQVTGEEAGNEENNDLTGEAEAENGSGNSQAADENAAGDSGTENGEETAAEDTGAENGNGVTETETAGGIENGGENGGQESGTENEEGDDINGNENSEAGGEEKNDEGTDPEAENGNETDESNAAVSNENENEEAGGESEETEEDSSPSVPDKEIEVVMPEENVERKWTILVYMSADNNLEYAAIEDLYEMEKSLIDDREVTVLVLIDRSPSYDTSNNNWSDSRLYKITTNKKSEEKKILSEEINCSPLSLYCYNSTELDMSSKYVLSEAVSYAFTEYPSEKNGVIIWGHGSGWRGEEEMPASGTSITKGFAYDSTSGTYMTLSQLRQGLINGLNGLKLDFLGFDTCFGGEMEVAYELRNCAEYFCGTEGLESGSGWNYERLFNLFNESSGKSGEALCNAALNQFEEAYENYAGASVCCVKLSGMEPLFNSFEEFCKNSAAAITDGEIRSSLLTELFCNTKAYSYGNTGSDFYLDLYEFGKTVSGVLSASEKVQTSYKAFTEAEQQAVFLSWASDRTRGGLGIFFDTLAAGNVLSTTHPDAYKKAENGNGRISFVNDSSFYVPGSKDNSSLLDKLFYWEP